MEVVNDILYVLKNGCVWRDLPGQLPPWGTVYWCFAKWEADGTWQRVSTCLNVSSQERGRKRLVLTDTLGNVLASRVLPTNAVDGPAAIAFWDEVAAAHDLLSQVQVVFVDSWFNGVFREHLAQRYGIRVEKPAHVLVEKTNFCIHAWRWIVERTFAWLSANRRLSKEYERGLRHANA